MIRPFFSFLCKRKNSKNVEEKTLERKEDYISNMFTKYHKVYFI